MLCQSCNQPIDPQRIAWCQSKGFPCKYCADCSKARKAQKAQAFNPPAQVDEQKWHDIAVSKIVHNFMLEGMKKDMKPKDAANLAVEMYNAQKTAVNFILEKEKMSKTSDPWA